ncbi:MAG: hypothetical protein NTU58_01415 [Candidatus Nealsonbacteria bacterium]|nr:hypothetical protein [Candidatus Nealsonbacteria bacterium]
MKKDDQEILRDIEDLCRLEGIISNLIKSKNTLRLMSNTRIDIVANWLKTHSDEEIKDLLSNEWKIMEEILGVAKQFSDLKKLETITQDLLSNIPEMDQKTVNKIKKILDKKDQVKSRK